MFRAFSSRAVNWTNQSRNRLSGGILNERTFVFDRSYQILTHQGRASSSRFFRTFRRFSTTGLDQNLRKRMDVLGDYFVDAREEISIAMESKETTYFDEEVKWMIYFVVEWLRLTIFIQ
jgi:hypothetical protein